MWVRGLKLILPTGAGKSLVVAPHVGAWIETIFKHNKKNYLESHPMWVRGLKLALFSRFETTLFVAPHVGAWIETIFWIGAKVLP